MFSIHSQGEKIDVLGNFYWCEFHLFSPKLREVRFLTLKIGGRLIHKVDLYTSKYGILKPCSLLINLVYCTVETFSANPQMAL